MVVQQPNQLAFTGAPSLVRAVQRLVRQGLGAHLRPADEVHLVAELLSQIRIRGVTEFGDVVLELCLELLMEPVPVDDNPAAINAN